MSKNNGLNKGRFSEAEDSFIRKNYATMTDRAMAEALNRATKSITNRRTKLGLEMRRNKPKITPKHREAFVATLDSEDRKAFFEKEVRGSAQYRAISASLSPNEQNFYIEKYADFMMDPSIETMTAMEKDALHQLLLAEIRINRHMAEERQWLDMIAAWDFKNGKPPAPISRAKEIRECQEVILKCQQSLNVERKQRLKNQNDQSITFSNLIKEMKNPQNRFRMGSEATMLKVITEKFYNSRLNKNIFSGKNFKYDLSKNFRDGAEVDLPDSFLPSVEENDND